MGEHVGDYIAPNASSGDKINVAAQPRTGGDAKTATEYTKQGDGSWKTTGTKSIDTSSPGGGSPSSSGK